MDGKRRIEPMWNDRDQFTPDYLRIRKHTSTHTRKYLHLSASHSLCCILLVSKEATHVFGLHKHTQNPSTNRKTKHYTKLNTKNRNTYAKATKYRLRTQKDQSTYSLHVCILFLCWRSAQREKSNLLVDERSQ